MPESAQSLKLEAEDIIQQLTLFEILGQYGEARLVGSCALDLIVKLDIDIHLVVGTTDLLSVVDRKLRSSCPLTTTFTISCAH